VTVPPLQYAAAPHVPMPRKGKGLAITALVVGAFALILSWVPVFGLLLGVVAGVFGAIGLMKSNKVLSVLGLALGGLSVFINIIVLAALAAAADTSQTSARQIGSVAEPTTATPVATEPAMAAPATTEPTTAAPATTEPTTAPATTEPAPPPAPAFGTPKPGDFILTVKNTSKQCFGSAGCNIEYRVKVALRDGIELDPDKSYDVTFDVRGGEDGPVTGTFTVEDGGYSGYDLDGFLSTSSSGKKLTAKATDVEEL
jgi:hypothetical protein